MKKHNWLVIVVMFQSLLMQAQVILDNQKIDGYKGIWFTLGQFDSEYGDKYSGGLGTYTAKHRPLAVYSEEANKTYFVYGGTLAADSKHLLCMISYYDHSTGLVPKPTVVYDKRGVDDPHDNPSLLIDNKGFIWVFVSGRGRKRPGFKYRSRYAHDINSFVQVTEEEMTYPQPHYNDKSGFFNFFTKYTGIRELYYETSQDGNSWTEDKKLAGIIEEGATKSGHYQVSGQKQNLLGTFFSRHPNGNVDRRTDLYYVQTTDFGATWTTAKGESLSLPLTHTDNKARVLNYTPQGKNVYLKDMNFDQSGNPVCLFLTSDGHMPGPDNGPRVWQIAHFNGTDWDVRKVFESDHNYDMGSLYIDKRYWSIIAPSKQGPQPFQSGGEIAQWESSDNGITWQLNRQLTSNSQVNHNYARRPLNAKDPFIGFWADGDPSLFSKSHLYFADSAGNVYQLPYEMNDRMGKPILTK